MIYNTGALLMLFIDSSIFEFIFECCPLQVERWLLQLNFPIGS